MAVYREGTITISKTNRRTKEKTFHKEIMKIDFENGVYIHAFQGGLSPNDILVQFQDTNIPGTKKRQPSHIHWAVDILIKKENEEELTNEFLKEMLKRWEEVKPLKNREMGTIIENLKLSRDRGFITKFSGLNEHGFFTMEFIIHLMEILMLQEKSNYPDAYMFRRVVQKILEFKDLYSIISTATQTGS